MPASQKQIDANRRNAQKSTGPKTAEGKQASSANATTHGLTAAATIYRPIRHENQADFQELRAALLRDCKPVGAQEQLAVEMMASAYKRIQRCESFEAAYFDGAMDAIDTRPDRSSRPPQAGELGCGIVIGKQEHKLTWENLDRYRRAAWLDYNRAQQQLRKLQKDRADAPIKEIRAHKHRLQYLRRTTAPSLKPVPASKMASFRDLTFPLQNARLSPDHSTRYPESA